MNVRAFARRPLRTCFAIAVALTLTLPAQAQDESANKILKSMADFMAATKSFTASLETDIEVVTSDLQKIQFTSPGRIALARPDKLRAWRTGGYADVEMVYDGKLLTLYDKPSASYAQAEAPASIDQLIDKLRQEHGVEAPAADLLLSNIFQALTEGVISAKHIGRGVIDGVECEHLAFRNEDTDWQIWIAVGAQPLPHKYVITSKAVTGGPQFTLRLRDWKVDAALASDAFAFTPPAGARKVTFKDLPHNDEVPAAAGGKR